MWGKGINSMTTTSGSMTQLKLVTKSGITIEVEISGYQERPKIIVAPLELKGKRIGGEARIIETKIQGKKVEVLQIYPHIAQVDIAALRKEIAKLPRYVCMARKVEETHNLDGDICTVHVWKIEGQRTTKNGRYLQDSEIGDFLDRKGVTEIETEKAVEMWSRENETPEKLAKRAALNKRGNSVAQHFADMEEMEN